MSQNPSETSAPEVEHYTSTAKWLHWLLAFFLLLDLSFGQSFHNMDAATKTETLIGHSSLGIILLTLILVRILWRYKNRPPKLPADMPFWQRQCARGVHLVLYGLMVYVPVSGLYIAQSSPVPVQPFGAASFGGTGMDEAAWHDVHLWHALGTQLLIGFIILHVGAALYHRFVRKDQVLQRMLPRLKRRGGG